jgi:hypothetical protein
MDDKRRKRPRDFNQAAKLVIDIATGQVEVGTTPHPDNTIKSRSTVKRPPARRAKEEKE